MLTMLPIAMIFVNQSAYGRRFLDQTASIGLRSMGSAGGHSVNHSIRTSPRLAPSKSARSTVSSPPLPSHTSSSSAKVCIVLHVVCTYCPHGYCTVACPVPVLCCPEVYSSMPRSNVHVQTTG